MEKLTNQEKRLYQTSIDSLNNRYSDYTQFDLKIIGTLDFDNLDIEDLYYLFKLSKYGTELYKKLNFEIALREISLLWKILIMN